MTPRIITINDLIKAAADALGKTEEEISKSETFEQAIYDMVRDRTNGDLPEFNVTKKAQFRIEDDKVTIAYTTEEDENAGHFIKKLADFYNAYFPATKVSATDASTFGDTEISFLAAPFIEKVMPAMKIWKNKPSELVLLEDKDALERGPKFRQFGHILANC